MRETEYSDLKILGESSVNQDIQHNGQIYPNARLGNMDDIRNRQREYVSNWNGRHKVIGYDNKADHKTNEYVRDELWGYKKL